MLHFCIMHAPRAFIPQPRRRGVVSQELDGETLLYVTETHQASALNGPASRIWALCDGTRSLEAIAIEAELFPDVVVSALRQLAEAGLLENGGQLPSTINMARRRMLASAAMAAIPVIMLVTAPRAEACATKGAVCENGAECCSGICLANQTCS
ncbi:MAG: PqqD family protein [Myxococcaceae bacterium]